MSALIDMSNNRANIAFTGDRKDIWHRLGTQLAEGASIEEWAHAAGLDWHVTKSPAFQQVDGEFIRVPDFCHLTRSDTKRSLGYVSEVGFKPVQPAEVLEWFRKYIETDDRFQLSCAGSLKFGGRIWATAKFNGPITVAGDEHNAHLFMCTGFDGSLATWNQGTVTRVVCNNTLMAALADKRAQIRTSHAAKFNAEAVRKQLATLAQSFDTYKAMGDAMALESFTEKETRELYKTLLDIPADLLWDDVSTRKQNQFNQLASCYEATVDEGTQRGTVWTALNAVTRYVDNERATQMTEGDPTRSRLSSAVIGSGADMKAVAWNLLMPRIKDRVAVAA